MSQIITRNSSKTKLSSKNDVNNGDGDNSLIKKSIVSSIVSDDNNCMIYKPKKRKKIVSNDNDVNDNNGGAINHKDDDELVEKNQPKNWKLIHSNIVKMRSESVSPVDTMGCDQCCDMDIKHNDKQRRFQLLIALMLSSQTRDQITFQTMKLLRQHNLSIEWIESISLEELINLIKSVGFYRRKAEFIKKTAKILKENFNGDIPNTLDDLKKLPGVGPKMAHLLMKSAWNEVTGIGVDTHVHRICNRLQWVRNTKTPEQTRMQLEEWLPKDLWLTINHLLVGFGQTICKPIKPNCTQCLNKHICPSSSFKTSTDLDF